MSGSWGVHLGDLLSSAELLSRRRRSLPAHLLCVLISTSLDLSQQLQSSDFLIFPMVWVYRGILLLHNLHFSNSEVGFPWWLSGKEPAL